MTQLTRKRLLAIREALTFRLAGALDDTDMPAEVYKAALEWTREKIASKPAPVSQTHTACPHVKPPANLYDPCQICGALGPWFENGDCVTSKHEATK